MHISMRSLWSFLACCLLVGLSLASCGGSNATPGNSMALNVGQISDSVAFFPFFVAEQQGFFKKEGVTLGSRPRLGTGAKVATALSAGSIDIAGGVITDAFNLATVDPHVRIIGSLVNGYYVDVVVSKSFEQQTHLTTTSPLADKVKALKGKKVGITGPGSGTEALMIYLFRQQGMDVQKETTLVNLGSNNSAAIVALRTGRVDALSFFSPIGQMAEAQGAGDIFISPIRGDIPALNGAVHGIFYTRQSVIDAKPKAVQAFIRAVGEAEAYIHDQPAQAQTLLVKYLKLNQTTSKAVYTAVSPVFAPNPQIGQKGYDVAAQFHVQAGLISIAPHLSDMVATDTISKALS
jgi:NitT/TauT family transport system substrate-binding protein